MDKFFDRELSALEFNARVLAEGMDPTNPLLERLKFIGIVSSNLDEFFMVRIASLKRDNASFEHIRRQAQALSDRMNSYFAQTLVPELESIGLLRLQPETASPAQMEYVKAFFRREVLPVLTPIALGEDRALPLLTNLGLHLAVLLKETESPDNKQAIVEIPQKILPRMLFLPTEKGRPFVLLEDVVSYFASELFPGYEIVEKALIRLTRGAEMTLDEEKDEDFMRVMTEALRERRGGDIVRLECSTDAPWLAAFPKRLSVDSAFVGVNRSWFDLRSISQIAFQPGFEAYKRPTWEPCGSADFERAEDLWELLKEKSVLLFHPYESFDAVVHFLQAAADDPDVLAIKQTLYRTDPDSAILSALQRAAEKGKRVTVLIELKARFDEENNIAWARRLIQAGVTVLYGVARYKAHAKALLVIRRERDGIKRYTHLGTGNYNAKTAKLYSDIGYLTSDDATGDDISAFFNMITGYSQPATWSKIDVAPFGLRRKLLRLINREIQRSRSDQPGIIRAKLNSLADIELIEALYKASNAGVRIQLNVRGICRLRPGVKGLSENIQVVSIVDQFLEHSRVFYFENGGNADIYLSSADWMPRNIDRRIEILFPVDEPAAKKRLVEYLDLHLRDNVKSWILLPDGSYVKTDATGRKRVRAQEILCQKAAEDERNARKAMPLDLKPQLPTP